MVGFALFASAFASWTGCHVYTSGSFTAGSSSSTEGQADFRIQGGSRVRAGATLVIVGDFGGLAASDVFVTFDGFDGHVSPQTISAAELTVIVPAAAISGHLSIFIHGKLTWTTSIHIQRPTVSEGSVSTVPRKPDPQVKPPEKLACTVSPSIATTETSIDISGKFGGIREQDVTVRFAGVEKPARPSLVPQNRLSVTVPKGTRTGTLQVLHKGQQVCEVTLTIAKKDDGLLATAATGRGLVGNIYKLPENTRALPDFGPMTPIGSIVVPNLGVAPRAFDTGFPGVDVKGEPLVEWFGIRFAGALVIDKAGAYEFEVNSDDGARIYIDGKLIIANDGIHPPKKATGEATLSAGEHRIRIDYYQGPRFYIALELRWKGPGQDELSIIPTSAFRRGLGPQQ